MKKKICFILSLLLAGAMCLQGCSGSRAGEQGTQSGTEPALGKASSQNIKEAGTEYGPGDDYYYYVNYNLLNGTEIPEDSNNWGYFYQLSNEAYEKLNYLLQEAVRTEAQFGAGSVQQKIAGLYRTAMDMSGRDKSGLGGLEPYMDSIRQSSGIGEYLNAVGKIQNELGIGSLMITEYDVDMGDSSKYACYLTGGDLGLGKETLEDEQQAKLHQEYKNYIAAMMEKTGMEKELAEKSADETFALISDLASASLPLADSGNPSKIYNKYTKKELCSLMANTDMESFLNASGVGGWDTYIVMEPEYLKKVNEYLKPENLETLKNYSVFCLMNDMGPYLSQSIRDEALHFYQFKSGAKSVKTDEKLASEITQQLLGFEFGRLYVENYFSEKSKQKVTAMVEQILAAYEKKIDALSWMSTKTKEAAKKKLENMEVKIGYPDQWPDYNEKVTILSPEDGGVLIDNVLELKKAYQVYEKQLAEGPVDRGIWQMTPQTVNAYYSPLANEIVFPAAILQAPFYDPKAGEAENLGGIGTVIAHEITHAFDNSGSQYDEKGNYHVWWTEEDYRNFEQKTQAVAEYYSGYEGYDGIYVNGAQTLGENIADLGAVSCVMEIAGENPETLKKLCARYARIWASKYTDESMRVRLNTDVHSPARVRVNAVLSSMEGFYLAYPEIQEGDEMYVEPGKRVEVW